VVYDVGGEIYQGVGLLYVYHNNGFLGVDHLPYTRLRLPSIMNMVSIFFPHQFTFVFRLTNL